MKIKKIPEEIAIAVEDVRFIFDKPCALDFLEMDQTSPKERVKALAKRLKRIEGATFEDGASVPNEALIDFPLPVVLEVVRLYGQEILKIYEAGDPQKKSETPIS